MAVLLAKKNIPAPADFDGVALDKWVEISERIAARGDWQDYNLGPLRILCVAYAAHDQATKTIATLGDVLEGERGYTRNPACLNQNAAAGTIAKLSAQLGETPLSRGRIKAPLAPSGNDFDEI